MKTFHSMIVNNYELQIIDTDVTIFKLNNTQSCVLEECLDKTYQIKEDEN